MYHKCKHCWNNSTHIYKGFEDYYGFFPGDDKYRDKFYCKRHALIEKMKGRIVLSFAQEKERQRIKRYNFHLETMDYRM